MLLTAEAWFPFQDNAICGGQSNSAAVGCPPSYHSIIASCELPQQAQLCAVRVTVEASACAPETEIHSDLQKFCYYRLVPYLYIFWASPSVLIGAVRFCIPEVPRSNLVPYEIQSKF